MDRVLFRFGGVAVHTYTALQYLGIVLGVFAQGYAATTAGLDTGRVLAASFLLLVPALTGARLLYVVLHWRRYRREPRLIWHRSGGGAALYGGLIFALPLSIVVLTPLKLSLAAYWDTASFGLLTGLIVGRVGCLLNGCCCGRPSTGPLAINLPDHGGVWNPRIPSQVLESLWAIVLLVGAFAIWQRAAFPGATALLVFGGYALGRFFLEATRQQQDWIGSLSVHRAFSVAVAVGAILMFVVLRRT